MVTLLDFIVNKAPVVVVDVWLSAWECRGRDMETGLLLEPRGLPLPHYMYLVSFADSAVPPCFGTFVFPLN